MIRRCELSDEKVWVKLNQEFMAYEYEGENAWENPLDSGDLGADFRSILEDPSSGTHLLLVIREEEPIGFMNILCFYSVWSHGQVFALDDFFITEKFRGKGYGRQALTELETYAKEQGIKRIQLLAENTNPGAVHFYEMLDYKRQEINLFVKYLFSPCSPRQ